MMRLIVVRHGATAWNNSERLQGQVDVPLSDQGRQQAGQIAERLAGAPLAAVYSSDLQRALDTATAIAAPHDLIVHPDARLRQASKGRWEGLTLAEIAERFPEDAERLARDPGHVAPDGESLDDVAARVAQVLAAIRISPTAQDAVVAIVAHGMILRTLIAVALGLAPVHGIQFPMNNAALSELLFKDGAGAARLIRHNDTAHLDYAPPHGAHYREPTS